MNIGTYVINSIEWSTDEESFDTNVNCSDFNNYHNILYK